MTGWSIVGTSDSPRMARPMAAVTAARTLLIAPDTAPMIRPTSPRAALITPPTTERMPAITESLSDRAVEAMPSTMLRARLRAPRTAD